MKNVFKNWKPFCLVAAILFIAGVFLITQYRDIFDTRTVVDIRWSVPSMQGSLFNRAAESLENEFNSKSKNKRLKITLIEHGDMSDENNQKNSRPSGGKLLKKLNDGEVEMLTTSLSSITELDKRAVLPMLPYVFSTLEEAFDSLDGAPGTKILAGLSDTTDSLALAFTLSGGYKMVHSSTPITSVSALAGLRITTHHGEPIESVLSALGATPVSIARSIGPQEAFAAVARGDADAVESTYTRSLSVPLDMYPKHVYETEHSLFLTTIFAGKQLYKEFTEDEKALFEAAVKNAAIIERVDSLAHIETTKQALRDRGVSIIIPSEEERVKLKAMTKGVRASYGALYQQIFGKPVSSIQ